MTNIEPDSYRESQGDSKRWIKNFEEMIVKLKEKANPKINREDFINIARDILPDGYTIKYENGCLFAGLNVFSPKHFCVCHLGEFKYLEAEKALINICIIIGAIKIREKENPNDGPPPGATWKGINEAMGYIPKYPGDKGYEPNTNSPFIQEIKNY